MPLTVAGAQCEQLIPHAPEPGPGNTGVQTQLGGAENVPGEKVRSTTPEELKLAESQAPSCRATDAVVPSFETVAVYVR
jgi:hypothetical protein